MSPAPTSCADSARTISGAYFARKVRGLWRRRKKFGDGAGEALVANPRGGARSEAVGPHVLGYRRITADLQYVADTHALHDFYIVAALYFMNDV